MTMTKENKRLVLIVVACLAAGYFLAGSSVVKPKTPAERRPVLAAIFRAAKTLLWLAAFAEQPPEQAGPRGVQHLHHVDDRGVVMVDHGNGW